MWIPPRSELPELLDIEALSRDEIAVNLADMALSNRLLGTARHLWDCFESLWNDQARDMTVTWLDLGAGRGDLATALLEQAAKSGRTVRPIISDRSEAVMDIAVERWRRSAGSAGRSLRLDAGVLPFADNSIDLVTGCHLLHHLTREQSVAMLQEMRRVCRRGFVAIDLHRSWWAYGASRLLVLAMGSGHRLSEHDGPLSVLRSFTSAELLNLAVAAGVPEPQVRQYPWQLALMYAKTPPAGDY